MSDKTKERKASEVIGCFGGILRFLVQLPLWFYLLYQVLERVGATTAMWVAYWTYVPVGLLCAFLADLYERLRR